GSRCSSRISPGERWRPPARPPPSRRPAPRPRCRPEEPADTRGTFPPGPALVVSRGMPKGVDRKVYLDPRETRLVEDVRRGLSRLRAGASSADVFKALRPCVGAEAGLLSILRPGALDAMVNHVVGLHPAVVDSWLGMTSELRRRILAPIIDVKPGGLRRES